MDTAKGYYENQIKGSIGRILETIRYTGDTEVIRAKQKSLKASTDSLGRMVKDLVADYHPELKSDALQAIEKYGSQGDLSLIMPTYESEIVAPLKGVLFGDIVRLVLIQVQKQKVDIEDAMLQIDKLMKANELNFQILAAVPLILTIYALRNIIFRKKLPVAVYHRIRTALRELNIFLVELKNSPRALSSRHIISHANALSTTVPSLSLGIVDQIVPTKIQETIASTLPPASTKAAIGAAITLESSRDLDSNVRGESFRVGDIEPPLDRFSSGRILVTLYSLFDDAKHLSVRERQWFLADLEELQNDRYTPKQRLDTLQRMYSTYKFLAIS